MDVVVQQDSRLASDPASDENNTSQIHPPPPIVSVSPSTPPIDGVTQSPTPPKMYLKQTLKNAVMKNNVIQAMQVMGEAKDSAGGDEEELGRAEEGVRELRERFVRARPNSVVQDPTDRISATTTSLAPPPSDASPTTSQPQQQQQALSRPPPRCGTPPPRSPSPSSSRITSSQL